MPRHPAFPGVAFGDYGYGPINLAAASTRIIGPVKVGDDVNAILHYSGDPIPFGIVVIQINKVIGT